MSLQVFEDFNTYIKNLYKKSIVTIYLNDVLEYGIHISNAHYEEYIKYETPKIIETENGNYINGTNTIKSRFVYSSTTKNNNQILFVISSPYKNVFNSNTNKILEEMQLLKEYL